MLSVGEWKDQTEALPTAEYTTSTASPPRPPTADPPSGTRWEQGEKLCPQTGAQDEKGP